VLARLGHIDENPRQAPESPLVEADFTPSGGAA
jgi:hypothetical protein